MQYDTASLEIGTADYNATCLHVNSRSEGFLFGHFDEQIDEIEIRQLAVDHVVANIDVGKGRRSVSRLEYESGLDCPSVRRQRIRL